MSNSSRILLFIFLTAGGATASNQFVAQYVPLGPSGTARVMAADASGDLFLVANIVESSGRPQMRAVKVDPNGSVLASFDFGGSSDASPDLPAGAAIDAQGNLVVVGTTWSADFPLVSPLISNTSTQAGFVVKLDAQLTQIIFSTRLGGSQNTNSGITAANAVALDAARNIYVTGSTSSADFPTTPGAFQKAGPPQTGFGSPTFAFVTEISSNGANIVYSTFFGSSGTNCYGGSSCIGVFGFTSGNAIAIDNTGAVVIGGTTTANQHQVTPGTVGQQCVCQAGNYSDVASGFLAKFAAGGGVLLWATYIPLAQSSIFVNFAIEDVLSVTNIALAADGSVVFSGNTPPGLPVTNGALQPSFPGNSVPPFFNANFVAKLNASAMSYLFSTYLGGGTSQQPNSGMAIDSQGNIWLTGSSDPTLLPFSPSAPQIGSSFIAEMSSDGGSILSGITAPAGAAGQAILILPNGSPAALGPTGSVLLNSATEPASFLGIANSAGIQVSSNVAPYELVSLFGVGLGPANPLNGVVQNGVLTNSLGGVQVLFNNVPAPLLYAGPNQINAIVPSAVTEADTARIQIVTPAGMLNGPSESIVPSEPEIFHSSPTVLPGYGITPINFAAALNQDGSVNSVSNPATSGSIVTVWATGAGRLLTDDQDGLIIPTKLYGLNPPTPELPVSILNDLDSLEVLYAGSAPGMVLGVVQVNFRLPSQAPAPTLGPVWFQLQIGPAVSSRVAVYVAP